MIASIISTSVRSPRIIHLSSSKPFLWTHLKRLPRRLAPAGTTADLILGGQGGGDKLFEDGVVVVVASEIEAMAMVETKFEVEALTYERDPGVVVRYPLATTIEKDTMTRTAPQAMTVVVSCNLFRFER